MLLENTAHVCIVKISITKLSSLCMCSLARFAKTAHSIFLLQIWSTNIKQSGTRDDISKELLMQTTTIRAPAPAPRPCPF
jgi:hypothetical protein